MLVNLVTVLCTTIFKFGLEWGQAGFQGQTEKAILSDDFASELHNKKERTLNAVVILPAQWKFWHEL